MSCCVRGTCAGVHTGWIGCVGMTGVTRAAGNVVKAVVGGRNAGVSLGAIRLPIHCINDDEWPVYTCCKDRCK